MSEDAIHKTPPPLPPDLPDSEPNKKKSFWRRPGGIAAIIGFALAGVLFIGFAVLGMVLNLGYFPDSAAVRGSDLPSHVVEKLVDADIIEPDEQVLYYYCAALFDYLEDGNLFTDKRVISYWEEGEQLQVEAAPYSEIADIDVEQASGWLDDALITIEREDGSQFVMYVSGEKGGDRKFQKELERAWARNR